MDRETREFGRLDPDVTYAKRPSAYGVALNASGHFAACQTPGGTFLPGGGLESDETPADAVCREVLEETGHEATVGAALGVAVQRIRRSDIGPFRQVGHFFRIALGDRRGPGESDHTLVWLRPDEVGRLRHASHRWAVNEVLRDAAPGT